MKFVAVILALAIISGKRSATMQIFTNSKELAGEAESLIRIRTYFNRSFERIM